MHPKSVDRHAQFLNLKAGARVGKGMTPIRADDKIGMKITFTVGSLHPNTSDALLVEDQIDHLVLHMEAKRREAFGFSGEKVQKIPLRHESDKFAVRRQTREIRHRSEVTIEDSAQLGHFLMRQLQKLIEQSELVHEIERPRM